MSIKPTLLLVALSPFALGCEVPELDTPDVQAQTNTAKQTEPEKKQDEPIDMSGVEGEPPAVTSEAREFVAKDGKQGKLSRSAGGYLGAVMSARVTAVNSYTKSLYTHALNLYWAETGYYPKTHEEFMEKIIKYNKLQLPELEAGVEYIYDPEDHLLKVHRPEK